MSISCRFTGWVDAALNFNHPFQLAALIACIEDPFLIQRILEHVQRRDGCVTNGARGPPDLKMSEKLSGQSKGTE